MCWFGLVLGPGSVLLLFSLLVSGETHIWLGDLQVVWCLGFCLLSWLLISFLHLFYCTAGTTTFQSTRFNSFYLLIPITGPSLRATSAKPEEKKYNAMISFAICANLRLLVVVSYLFFVLLVRKATVTMLVII